MNVGFFMLIVPIIVVILIFVYMAYVYFTQYRHATPDKQIQLRNKFFGSSTRYQLTEDDHQKIATGELKIDYGKSKEISLPLKGLLGTFVIWLLVDKFFLKEKLKLAKQNCELWAGLFPIYLVPITGWLMFTIVGICSFWLLQLQHKKAQKTGYMFDSSKKNPEFSLYKRVDEVRIQQEFLLRKILMVLTILAMFWGITMPLNSYYKSANIQNSPFNVAKWQENSQFLQQQCKIDKAKKVENPDLTG